MAITFTGGSKKGGNVFPGDSEITETSFDAPVSTPTPVADVPNSSNQPSGNVETCMFSHYGFSMSETPIFLNGTISDYFNGAYSPPVRLVDTESPYREEASKRLSQYYGVKYMFINTGNKINSKCLIDFYQGQLEIPYTNKVVFLNWYFPEYNERLYVGSDMFLYRLEIHAPEDPSRPTLPDPPPGKSLGSGQYLYRFSGGDVLPSKTFSVTKGIWTSGIGNLLTFFTSSAMTQPSASKRYNLEIRDYIESDCRSRVQFYIAYGHSGGSGSKDLGGYDYLTPTKGIYKQYAQLCLDDPTRKFEISGSSTDSIYVINFSKSVLGEELDVGNWELNLHELSGSYFTGAITSWTGSMVSLGTSGSIVRLIDDSAQGLKTVTTAGSVFQVVSGSLEQGIYNPTSPDVYGLVYPKLGVVVLNGDKLDTNLGFLTVKESDKDGYNHEKLWKSIRGAASYTDISGDSLGFQARRVVTKYQQQYYVRVKNDMLNFSNNPTFYSGSDGLIISDFVDTPGVYVTTIGLYNQRRELLAVARLSKPIRKTFTEELLLEVNLIY